MDYLDLKNRFDYHPPKDQETIKNHEDIRDRAYSFALVLDEIVPDSREKAVAITKIEEAMMWANAGIARNN